MKKRLILTAAFIAAFSASHLIAMEERFPTEIRLYTEEPEVKIIIPGQEAAARDCIITGEQNKNINFWVPYTDQIGVKFPGEDEPIFFDRDRLHLLGSLRIRVIKKDPQGYGVELQSIRGPQTKIIYIHNVGE